MKSDPGFSCVDCGKILHGDEIYSHNPEHSIRANREETQP